MPISAGDLATAQVAALDDYMRNRPIDQIGTERPLVKKLMAGRKKLMPARNTVTNVRKGYGSNFGWSYGDAPRTFNKRDTVDQATFPWRVATDGMYMSWDDLFSSGIRVDPDPASKGKLVLEPNEKVILFNKMTEDMQALELGFIEKLDLELHRSGTSGADAIVGLDTLVSATPSAAGAIGGLDPSTKTYWRNGFAGGVATNALVDTMESQWLNCIRNGGSPDFILAGTTFIKAYRACITLTQNTDAGKPKTIDASTGTGSRTGLFFKGVEIIWDPVFSVLDALEAPASSLLWEKRCYFLNTKHIKYEDDGMEIYNPTPPHNVRATYTSLDLRCALKTDRRNAHALIVAA